MHTPFVSLRTRHPAVMQSLFLDLWNSVRRAQISVKRDRDTVVEGSSALEASAPPKRQKLADVSSHPPITADTGSALCCLYQLKPAVTPHGLISGLPERRASCPLSEAQVRTSAASSRKLEITALPVDVLRMMSQELPTADRVALRQTCKLLFDSVSFGGIRLAYPMVPSERRLIPSLAKRPALTQLQFVQTDERGALRKRDFKTLLSRLGDAPTNRRYSVHISINGKVTTADMVWLEQQFGTKGYTTHIAKMSIHCHVADFQSAFPLTPKLSIQAHHLTDRTCLAIRLGMLKNLESLSIRCLRDENDVQMAWLIADRAVSPGLRSLQLNGAAAIPVGCRRMHPDFSHLEHLSVSRDIYLCINFICHLLPLRTKGLDCCESLNSVLDEYIRKKREGSIYLPEGVDEVNQHGFLVPFIL